jgi:hypothetical protein
LQMASLSLGKVVADSSVTTDTVSAYVYKQSPVFGAITDTLKVGQPVQVYVTKDKTK